MPPLDKLRQEVLRKKRWRKELKRKRKGPDRVRRYYNASSLLNFVREHLSHGPSPTRFTGEQGPGWVINIPRQFSFISNPHETIETLAIVVKTSKQLRNSGVIYLNHRACEEIDIAASALLDVLVLEMRRETKCEVTVLLPRSQSMRDVIQCMGITRHLRMRGGQPSPETDENFTKFQLFTGKKALNAAFGSDQERAATELFRYLSESVGRFSEYRLDDEFERAILRWSGEIITNAEEHSGRDEWFAIGYMVPLPNVDSTTPIPASTPSDHVLISSAVFDMPLASSQAPTSS